MNEQTTQRYGAFARDHGIGSAAIDSYTKFAQRGIITAGRISPNVVEDGKEYNVIDVFTRLMADRIIVLGTGINDDVANIVNAQLLFLEAEDDKAPITMYINSPGGSCYAGLALYDVMQLVSCPVETVVTGMAASMGFVLSVSGDPGRRFALPHSRLMQHQPSGSPGWGDTTNLNIFMKEMISVQDDLYAIIAAHTGQSKKKVKNDCERDHWMKPVEAKKYGAIDEIFDGRGRKARIAAEKEEAAKK